MMSNFFRLLVIVFLLNIVFVAPVKAYDIEPIQIDPSRQDFVVGPGRTELTINPGEDRVIEIMISNRTGLDREFEIKFEDFTGSYDLSSPIVFTNEKGATTMKDFLSVAKKTFFLRDGYRARVPVRVSVPEGAEPGGRYASVLISTLTPVEKNELSGGERQGGVPLITQTGTLVFVTIPGEIKKEGRITEFYTQNKKQFFSSPKDVVFNLIFENTGRIHLRPYGSIVVRNILGQEVRNIEVSTWFAMPDSIRLREVNLVSDPASDQPFMFGRYLAESKIFRDYDNLYDVNTLVFWIIPWKILLIIFLIILFVVLIIGLLIRYISSHFEIRPKIKDDLPSSEPTISVGNG